jgi:hypothetical protein
VKLLTPIISIEQRGWIHPRIDGLSKNDVLFKPSVVVANKRSELMKPERCQELKSGRCSSIVRLLIFFTHRSRRGLVEQPDRALNRGRVPLQARRSVLDGC